MCCKFVKQIIVAQPGERPNKSSVKSRTHKLFVTLPSKHGTILIGKLKYSKPSLMWINCGEVVQINEAIITPKEKKTLRKQISEKLNK
jgi:hypothetical protein